MDNPMDLPGDHLMAQFMEPLMYLLMDHLTDKPTHLMGLGINLRISHLIMALQHLNFIRGNLGSKMGLIRKRSNNEFCELEFKNQ